MNTVYIWYMHPITLLVVGIILTFAGLAVLLRAYSSPPTAQSAPPVAQEQRVTKQISSTFEAVEAPLPMRGIEDEHEPENYRKGREFEQYVLQRFLRKSQYFRVINQRHDRLGPAGKPLPDNSNPDLEIEAGWMDKRQTFAVECKFRSHWLSNRTIEWCNGRNLDNYRKFSADRRIPVFAVIGVGGVPSAPLEMFVFQITSTTTTIVKQVDLHNSPKPQYPGFFFNFATKQLQYREASA